jgi:hypothetical protein
MNEDYRNAPAHRFARDIAAAMGIEWAYDGAKLNVRQVGYIDGPSGARIGIVLDPWYDDPSMARRDYRVEVIGCYPEVFGETMRPHKHPSPKITCSPERTPAAIAGDIERRFLPDYWLSLAEAREMAARRERDFYAMLDGMRVLSETLEAPFHPDPRDGRDPVVRFSGADVHATFRWSGAYGLHVEIRWLPLEAAVEVAEVLKRFGGVQIPAHQVHTGG